MMEWRPIETAPKDGTHVLAYFADIGITEAWYFVGTREDGEEYGHRWDAVTLDQHGCGCCSHDDAPPTRWMPLPKPPGAE